MITLIDFSDPAEIAHWTPVDDVVMGGRSHSRLAFDPTGHALFSGCVSFENNGGFASVRRAPDTLGRDRVLAYLLEVCGDGKAYKLNLRTDDRFDGINYQHRFVPPAGRWTICRVACADFLPTWRGRVMADAPALDAARVRQAGLLIADRQEGPFALAIRAIGIETANLQPHAD